MHIEEIYLYFATPTLISCKSILFSMQIKCELGHLYKNVEKTHMLGLYKGTVKRNVGWFSKGVVAVWPGSGLLKLIQNEIT